MTTLEVAQILLGICVVALEALGLWLIRFGQNTSHADYALIGRALVAVGFAVLVFGVVGFTMARIR